MTTDSCTSHRQAAQSAHVLPEIHAVADEMVQLRHHLHQHPELAFEEFATSDLVAERLSAWGYEVHRGLGGTGVVGTLRLGNGPMRLGLRADMDALPIHETTGLPYASQHPARCTPAVTMSTRPFCCPLRKPLPKSAISTAPCT
mgnify:CR=1 FL=1